MTIANLRRCLFMVAVVMIAGCGKQERIEAVQFSKVLTEKKTVFESANTTERDLIKNAKAWCASITANGAGRGAQLDQNAAVATELAKTAVAISSQLSEVRKAVEGQRLEQEYPRSIRNDLIREVMRRQRHLQEVRAILEQSAPQFLEFKQSKAYEGDSYPEGIAKLQSMLSGYQRPEDALGSAIAALQTKYNLTSADL